MHEDKKTVDFTLSIAICEPFVVWGTWEAIGRVSFATFPFECRRIADMKAHMRLKWVRSVLTSELRICGGRLLVPFDAVWLVSMSDE